MKIGILTQPLHLNYGGVLQAWALQQVLKKMGHEPEIISRYYYVPILTVRRIIWQIIVTCWSIFDRIINKKTIIYNPFKRKYGRWYPGYCDYNFIKNNISCTKNLYSEKEFNEWINNNHYDAFIVGSDQVWREAYSPCLNTFFLDFLHSDDSRKKIAYAASFGTEEGYITSNKIPRCKELLNRFDRVSVREDGALSIVKDVFNRNDVIKVLDPTLLLNAIDYKALINAQDNNKKGYIAAYILDSNNDIKKILEDLSSRFSLTVDVMSAMYDGKKMPTISQWLANIANSDFVITDSFHGCVFSIIFRKTFLVIGNTGRGLDRFNSLLGSFNLSNRIISSFNDYKEREMYLMLSIDYNSISENLKQLQKVSLKFLNDALAKDICYSTCL